MPGRARAPQAVSAIAGLVLAGGRAMRLGGGDKTLFPVGGQTMLARILERLAPQCAQTALSANGDPERFVGFGLPVLPDDRPADKAGPLAGILAGLDWARRETPCRYLLTAAGDTPFFPRDLTERLFEATAGQTDCIAIATSGGRRHPVFGLWPLSVAEDLRVFLADPATLSVSAFLDRHPVVTVDFPVLQENGMQIDPFFNVNTPEDLATAEAICRSLA